MKNTLLASAFAAACLIAAPAAAATQIVNGSGQLTGATGVMISGSTYSVEFVDGTCAALFGGCDSASDFTFQSYPDAAAAAAALMAQVFTGGFDTDYTLTFGCSLNNQTGGCNAIIPNDVGSGIFGAVRAFNSNTEALDSSSNQTSGSINLDTAGFTDFVWARFTLSAAPVPEPSTWAMMLLGFGGIGIAMRRRRRSALTQLA